MRQTASRNATPYYYRLGYTLIMTLLYAGMGFYFILQGLALHGEQTDALVPAWAVVLCGVVLILYGGLRLVRSLRYRRSSAAIVAGLAVLLAGCQSKRDDRYTDTFTTGVIRVAVDESFAPVMAEEAKVFENQYPLAGIVPVNVSETEALNLFLLDSVRVAITTRPLSADETASFEARKFYPKSMKIATDGIALIVNNSNTDTLISVAQIKQVLGGELTTWQQLGRTAAGADSIKVVFDNANSSTLRFMLDSICGGELAGARLFAQKSNPDVIDYVARTPGALGIIGVSWIGERSDSTLISFIDRVRVVSVSAEPVATASNSCKPYQAYIALGQYPLRRDIFALLNDPRGALPSSFYTFLSSDRGQRILLKAGIVPATQPLRIVNVNPL